MRNFFTAVALCALALAVLFVPNWPHAKPPEDLRSEIFMVAQTMEEGQSAIHPFAGYIRDTGLFDGRLVQKASFHGDISVRESLMPADVVALRVEYGHHYLQIHVPDGYVTLVDGHCVPETASLCGFMSEVEWREIWGRINNSPQAEDPDVT